MDNNAQELLAENTYNDLSQLVNKKVGNNLQSIDYTYNIRGWMTKINDPANLNGKLFGYKVKYSEVEGFETPNTDFSTLKVKPKYNGNIAEVDWRTGTTTVDNLRRYGYVYDGVNRLLAGFYQKDSNPSAKEYFEKMDYDLNGNITHLKRSAESQQGSAAFNIDDLTYAYANNNQSNRLSSVMDSSTDYRGYPEVSGIAIPYDVNGNMISHKDKGILNMAYNFLNLPNRLTFDQTYQIRNIFSGVTETHNITTTYLFRADGAKLNKIYMYGLGKNQSKAYKITEYLDGFQYEGQGSSLRITRTLKFVPTSEGYYNFENNKYIYNYTDHLENVRLSYYNNGGSVAVLEENNYYPFGMKHSGYNGSVGNPSYQYKYNGKELQTESGMYDYGARFYMPDVGRWGVVDPAAELGRRFSPYNYAFDNPIMFVDPDGMWPWPTWSQVKSYAKGAWSTGGSMIKGAVTSTYTSVAGGVREAGKVYNAYQTGGVKAAVKQYGKSVYETSGAKSIVETTKKAVKGDAEAMGSLAVIASAAVITHKAGGTKGGSNSNVSAMGDLTKSEVGQIQTEVNKAGRPLEVVGSAAEGTRRNVGSDLPLGKGPGTRSDIDYIAPPSSIQYFEQNKLPSIDPNTGIIPGYGNEHIGPVVRFEPVEVTLAPQTVNPTPLLVPFVNDKKQ